MRVSPGLERTIVTDRQRTVVSVAIESGYHDSPRDCTVADVAAALEIAPGTVAEHLRKAESAVMRHAVDPE